MTLLLLCYRSIISFSYSPHASSSILSNKGSESIVMSKLISSKSISSLALFFLPPLALHYLYLRERRKQEDLQQRQSSLLAKSGETIRPPLPKVIQTLLSHCRLAYLSTVDIENNSSHLSLMRFTYLKDEEVIILSTNKRTKKYDILRKQKGLALLVHEFGQFSNEGGGCGSIAGYSITLNGECQIETGEEAERHRAAHLKHNPGYPQFIVGDDIVILCVNVTSARICNIHDQVEHWSVQGNANSSSSSNS